MWNLGLKPKSCGYYFPSHNRLCASVLWYSFSMESIWRILQKGKHPCQVKYWINCSFLWSKKKKKNPTKTSLGIHSLYVVVRIFSMCELIMQPVCILYCTVAMVTSSPFLSRSWQESTLQTVDWNWEIPRTCSLLVQLLNTLWQTLFYLSRNSVLANNCVRSIQKQQLVLKKRNNSNKIKSSGRKCCRHRVSTLQSRQDDWVSTAICPTLLRGWIIPSKRMNNHSWEVKKSPSHCQPCRSSLEKFENVSEL